MSRNPWSEAVTKESGSADDSITATLRTIVNACEKRGRRFKTMETPFDQQYKKFGEFNEEIKKTNQAIDELQLQVPQPRHTEMGICDRMSMGSMESPPRLGREGLPRQNCSEYSRSSSHHPSISHHHFYHNN